jgi:hypothetical protein
MKFSTTRGSRQVAAPVFQRYERGAAQVMDLTFRPGAKHAVWPFDEFDE